MSDDATVLQFIANVVNKFNRVGVKVLMKAQGSIGFLVQSDVCTFCLECNDFVPQLGRSVKITVFKITYTDIVHRLHEKTFTLGKMPQDELSEMLKIVNGNENKNNPPWTVRNSGHLKCELTWDGEDSLVQIFVDLPNVIHTLAQLGAFWKKEDEIWIAQVSASDFCKRIEAILQTQNMKVTFSLDDDQQIAMMIYVPDKNEHFIAVDHYDNVVLTSGSTSKQWTFKFTGVVKFLTRLQEALDEVVEQKMQDTESQGKAGFMQYTIRSLRNAYPRALQNDSFFRALNSANHLIEKIQRGEFHNVERRFQAFVNDLVSRICSRPNTTPLENTVLVARLFIGNGSPMAITHFSSANTNEILVVMNCLQQIAIHLNVDELITVDGGDIRLYISDFATGVLATAVNTCDRLLEFFKSDVNCLIISLAWVTDGHRQAHANALFVQKHNRGEVIVTHFDPHGSSSSYMGRTKLAIEQLFANCGVKIAHYSTPDETFARSNKKNPLNSQIYVGSRPYGQREDNVLEYIEETFPTISNFENFKGLCTLYVFLIMLQVIARFAVANGKTIVVSEFIKQISLVTPSPEDIVGVAGLLYQVQNNDMWTFTNPTSNSNAEPPLKKARHEYYYGPIVHGSAHEQKSSHHISTTPLITMTTKKQPKWAHE